jgi:hypothetical protein
MTLRLEPYFYYYPLLYTDLILDFLLSQIDVLLRRVSLLVFLDIVASSFIYYRSRPESYNYLIFMYC